MSAGRNRPLGFSDEHCVLTNNIGARRNMTLRKPKYETIERLVKQNAQLEMRSEIFVHIMLAAVFNRPDNDAQCRIAEGMVAKECDDHHKDDMAMPELNLSQCYRQRCLHSLLWLPLLAASFPAHSFLGWGRRHCQPSLPWLKSEHELRGRNRNCDPKAQRG
ncbi:MAG: hypothetical protein WC205_03115 [Opitutaceae bacterium]|jgi:hypothetical protein